MTNYTKIRPVGAELFQADGRAYRQTDRQTDRHDEGKSLFEILQTRLKMNLTPIFTRSRNPSNLKLDLANREIKICASFTPSR